ncbi:hypothetical protein PM082_002291 [Marasmius tenuissimus]|nr:hypothetical protein PM082_002291 [Marasmius tenuissimus]
MKMFIWALRELGFANTPSYYGLRQAQEQLQKTSGIPNIECKSVQGKVFYINDIRTIIAHDWLNPLVQSHIQVYPEIPEDGQVSEVWHAEKWLKTLDPDLLSPMYDAGTKHYYVYELAQLRNGDTVIPIRWILDQNRISADAYLVGWNEVVCYSKILNMKTAKNLS